MRWRPVSFLIILPFITIILFSPLCAWSVSFTATNPEIWQNKDDTYSLYTTIEIDKLPEKRLDIKLALKIVKSDDSVIIIPITTTSDGLYSYRDIKTKEIKGFLIPGSKDIFPNIKKATLIYAESGTDNWQELANGSGEISLYKDKKGLPIIFAILPTELSLQITKVNGKMPKDNKVSLSLKSGSEVEIELEIHANDYKTIFNVTYYYYLDDQPKKEGGMITIVGPIQKETIKYKWNGEKMIGVEISVRTLTSTSFVNISNKRPLSNIIWTALKKNWLIILIVLAIGFVVLTFLRIRSKRSSKRSKPLDIYNKDQQDELKRKKDQQKELKKKKDQQDELKHKKKQDSESSKQKDRKKQKESHKESKESWFSKLWQRKPTEAQNVSFEFSEDNKQFRQKIPHAKDFNGKPEWLNVNRIKSGSSVYIFELYYFNGERKPGVITFYDKKVNGNAICTVNVSYKAQVIAKSADISNVANVAKNVTEMREELKNPTISTYVKDKVVEEKVDVDNENQITQPDSSNIVLYRNSLLINYEGRKGKTTLDIPGDMITEWIGKPDWIKIDESHKNERKYSFEALSLNNKPEITLSGYNSKKQLIANIEIIPDKSGKKEPSSQEYYQIDSTSVLKNDGDRVVVVLKPNNNYTDKVRIISEVKPLLNTEYPINGRIYDNPSGIDEERIASLSIEKNYQKNMYDNELKINVTYTIQNGTPYVICKLPEQSSEGISKQLINLTLEVNGKPLEFRVSDDRKIKLEITRDGQLKADQSDNPQKITVPNPDNLGAKLITNLSKLPYNTSIDINEQDIKDKRESLMRVIENPDDTKALIRLFGLPEKKSITVATKTVDQDLVNKGVTRTTSIQEKPIDEIKFKNNGLAKVLSELRNEIRKTSYYEKALDDEILKKISDTISSDDFSIDDPSLRSLINWGVVFYKRKDRNRDIWDKFVEKMRDLGIFVIYKDGSQYNEIDYVSTEGPVKDATVAEVIQPGFKTSAGYGGVPRVIEPAVVITKPTRV